jgi:hypothetical protein
LGAEKARKSPEMPVKARRFARSETAAAREAAALELLLRRRSEAARTDVEAQPVLEAVVATAHRDATRDERSSAALRMPQSARE